MVKIRKYCLLLLIGLSGFYSFSHEKTPCYLQIQSEEGTVNVSFKYPVDRGGRPTVYLDFPGDWKLVSENNAIIGETGIKDLVFDTEFTDGLIGIRRTGLSDSKLVLTLIENGKSSTFLIDSKQTSFQLENLKGSRALIFKDFTLLGVEHILLGIDHLLFVLALLFLVRGKDLIGAITAFTIAHSITLVISTLHIVAIPPTVVEALIAFSIVLLAVEVFRPEEQHQSKNYVAMAFFFGLLHGFGFAGVLAKLGLPEDNLLIALFSFNIGVELGQLLFVGLVLMIMPLMIRRISKDLFVKVCSYVIGSIGAYWFLDRTIGAWML